MNEQIIRIHEQDNVAVAVDGLAAGQTVRVGGRDLTALRQIPPGHKIALVDIPAGSKVVKYGFPIGRASRDIPEGEWVHSDNLSTALSGAMEYRYEPKPGVGTENGSGATFRGFLRENGDVGVRNEVWIINTVGCVNKTAERIASVANAVKPDGVEGVYSFPHPFGCSQLGNDLENTQKILTGLVHHPNAAGVLVLGLGCENNNIAEFRKALGPVNGERVLFLNAQETGDEIAEGMRLTKQLMEYASRFRRSAQPFEKLRIGLKCGGSDAFSGITANPLLGRLSNRLVAAGGAVAMTEVPEMFGAETTLLERCATSDVFSKAVAMVNGFKRYFLDCGQPVYENPSPGNKEGGITTLEEKSLGCVQKGGEATVTNVLEYGQRDLVPGLNLLSGPGNDLVACTALAAAGAQLILFTTGRGTPLGGPVPTVKVSTNSALNRMKGHWIDFDAGRLLNGVDMAALADELFGCTLAVAEGRLQAKNETNGYREIGIFKGGICL